MEIKNQEMFPEYYLTLFRAVTRAIDALDEQNYGIARRLLVQGQQAEALILDEGE